MKRRDPNGYKLFSKRPVAPTSFEYLNSIQRLMNETLTSDKQGGVVSHYQNSSFHATLFSSRKTPIPRASHKQIIKHAHETIHESAEAESIRLAFFGNRLGALTVGLVIDNPEIEDERTRYENLSKNVLIHLPRAPLHISLSRLADHPNPDQFLEKTWEGITAEPVRLAPAVHTISPVGRRLDVFSPQYIASINRQKNQRFTRREQRSGLRATGHTTKQH